MDQRFWKQKKMLPVYNNSSETIKPFTPVVFSGYPNFEFTDQGENRTRFGDRVAWPVYGNTVYLGWNQSLILINGPNEIPPAGYGEASQDYPLPCLVDPESFPVWEGDYNVPPVAGSFDQYISHGGNEGFFPPVGLRIVRPVNDAVFAPASFTSQLPIWTALCWDVEPDGSKATDRVIVVKQQVASMPVAGGLFFTLGPGSPNGNQVDSTGTQLISPLPVISDGLYSIEVSAEVEIQQVGTPVALRIGYIQGPNAPQPQDSSASSPAQPSSPGDGKVTYYLTQAGRKMPVLAIDESSGSPYKDDDEVHYSDYGYETVALRAQAFAFKEDKFTLEVHCPGSSAHVVISNGIMTFRKVDEPMHGGQDGVGFSGYWGGYPYGWGSGYYGYGWGWGGWWW